MDPDVYRTPGRAAAPERIPRPSLRTMGAPLAHAAAVVALATVVVSAFALVAPPLFGTSDSGTVRFVPSIDAGEDAIAVLLPASIIFLFVLVARRVRPSWGGLRRRERFVYLAALLAVQSVVVAAGEAAMFSARGGLRLFGPTYLASRWLPDGRTAHLYTRGGLQCGYEVFVSPPLSFIATRSYEISRKSCLEPRPEIRVSPDGSLDLVDEHGQPLESEPSPTLWFGHSGC